MGHNGKGSLPEILAQHQGAILNAWVDEQTSIGLYTGTSVKDADLREQCKEFLTLLGDAIQNGDGTNVQGAAWTPVRQMLGELSRSRGLQGFSPAQTATFIFSLKRPLFAQLGLAIRNDGPALAQEIWATTELLDKLGVYTTEVHLKTREEVIVRQQQEMLELSTPVVQLWDGILALPMIGTLDSARTQIVMETLLQRIVETGSGIAIIDITGVPTIDTLTAQHLLKTVAAARLMGAECVISGIRPQIAQTIVHLGVDLGEVITKASLADAFAVALSRTSRTVVRLAQPKS